MHEIEYREYRPEDADSFLHLHDSAFPSITSEYWAAWSRGDVTAAVAIMDGEVVGTVPFVFRDFRLRADTVARIAWEYSVVVREDLRDKGVGSRAMDAAKRFLRGRCAAMAVYRGDERSNGYRYYHRNGHQDLLYARVWTRGGLTEGMSSARISTQGVLSCTWCEFLADEAKFLDVFASAYGAYGGYPEWQVGFYANAVDTVQYNEVPVELAVFVARDSAGVMQGYAIIGQERTNAVTHLLEIAARDNNQAAALRLLAAFCDLADEKGAPPKVMTSDASPYVPAFRMLGFQPSPRADDPMMIMAYPLEPEGLTSAAWREGPATDALDVMAWTPQREVYLHRAKGPNGRRIVLEMKEHSLTRLLFSRLDLLAALRQETVTAVGAGPADLEAIAQALPFTPWVYHYLDQI
jgi:predicted N-acetyltransferase YhbS